MEVKHYETGLKRILSDWANENLKKGAGEFWQVIAIDNERDVVVFKIFTEEK